MDNKKALEEEIKTRVRTVFIGAISSIEESRFGELRTRSPEWEEEFQELRRDILNKGNDQLRMLLEELREYDVKKRYRYHMPTFDSMEEINAYKRGIKEANNKGNRNG